MIIIKNKFKLILIIVLISIPLMFFISPDAASTSDISSVNISKRPQLAPGERYLATEEMDEIVKSKEFKIAKTKTEKRLEHAWEDISKVLEVDGNTYTRITTDDLSKGAEKVNPKFGEKDMNNTLNKTHGDMMKQMQIGFTKPIAFVKNDCTEIVFASKDEDGNIVAVRAQKMADNTWVNTIENKKGKPLLKMEDIKVDEVE